LLAAPLSAGGSTWSQPAPEPGSVGGPGLAVHARKLLVVPLEGPQVVNNGTLLVRDGKIEAVGRRAEIEVPEDYEVVDVGDDWLMPGIIELHAHVGGTMDINDMVYLTNPGIRASTAVIPGNPYLKRGVAGGVTAALFIPGSGTNIGGQGVLIKTAPEEYQDALLRNPGSMKLAQAGNPERFSWGVGRALMNWHTRHTLQRGTDYAKERISGEESGEELPPLDPQWEVFLPLVKKETQVSAHTQMYQVSLMTCTMVQGEFDIDVYIDHGTFSSYRMAAIAQEMGVEAILGPRSIDMSTAGMRGWAGSDTDGRMQGVAAGYQERGHKMIGFNTDCVPFPMTPPLEELFLQASVGARYGLDDANLDTVRGLTIVPAVSAGLGDRLGSLEPGKDADFSVVTGHPCDPRNRVTRVWVDGKVAYDPEEDGRVF
jgi:imidazolonepropionase-like amidohydrolase